MKRFHYILTLATICSFLFANSIVAQNNQNTKRRSPVLTKKSEISEQTEKFNNLTTRAKELNERLTQNVGNARWMRIVYREIDLTKPQNGPLYYPIHPMNGMQNLFAHIFELMSQKKLTAYEYLDGFETFDETHEIKFKELLDRFYILYDEAPVKGRADTAYIINESDIPSADVKSYYIKEAYFFNQDKSVFDTKILAICPILYNNGDMGETRMPMFWLPYEEIRPYINTKYVMTSNTNNAMVYTIDDYLRRKMYTGDIIKTQNLMNQPLQAYCPTPDSLKKEQQRIEKEITTFQESLWLAQDSTEVASSKKETRSIKKKKDKVKVKKTAPKRNSTIRSIRGRR